MAALGSRTAILGSVVAVLAVIGLLTVRAGRPASITAAVARGEHPPAPPFNLPRLDREGSLSLMSLRGEVVVLKRKFPGAVIDAGKWSKALEDAFAP